MSIFHCFAVKQTQLYAFMLWFEASLARFDAWLSGPVSYTRRRKGLKDTRPAVGATGELRERVEQIQKELATPREGKACRSRPTTVAFNRMPWY